jgi:hypothetical protein
MERPCSPANETASRALESWVLQLSKVHGVASIPIGVAYRVLNL